MDVSRDHNKIKLNEIKEIVSFYSMKIKLLSHGLLFYSSLQYEIRFGARMKEVGEVMEADDYGSQRKGSNASSILAVIGMM